MDWLKIKDTLFNRNLTCNLCGRENFNGKPFCDKCYPLLERNDGYICDHCGSPVEYPVEYCNCCAGKNVNFDFARSEFIYTGEVKKLIRAMKFSSKAYLADVLAEETFEKFIKCGYKADIVLYVPMTKKRERSRGYNQGRLIARRIAYLAGLPLGDGVVSKKEGAARQVGLTREERRRNLDGSFRVEDKSAVAGKRVLLVDDVMTTGSTMDVLAAALKKAGAAEVSVLTVAVTARKFNFHAGNESDE